MILCTNDPALSKKILKKSIFKKFFVEITQNTKFFCGHVCILFLVLGRSIAIEVNIPSNLFYFYAYCVDIAGLFVAMVNQHRII